MSPARYHQTPPTMKIIADRLTQPVISCFPGQE
jgi:hypothetical protein